MLAAAGIAWAATTGSSPVSASNATKDAGDQGVARTTNAAGEQVPVISGTNILVVGSDARTDAQGNPLTAAELAAVSTQADGGGVNTDTIMIMHIPDGGGRATAVSIPRDTWIGSKVVNAPGITGPDSSGEQVHYKPNKINAFYGSAKFYTEEYLVSKGITDQAQKERDSNEAGRTLLIKVVQQFTGLKINHYAEVNLLGFYLLSTAIGGVPVCLNHAVNDPYSGANFSAGQQEVQGSAALSFVRQRHGLPGGDLDRVKRQQAFLYGAADKILSVGTLTSPSKLSALIAAANRSLVLDQGFDLLTFAQQMSGLTSGNINFVTIPTTGPEQSTSADALATDPVAIRAFFQKISDGAGGATDSAAPNSATAPTTVDRSAVTVDVQNGTMAEGMAAAIGQTIKAAGFERGQLSDFPGTTTDNQQKSTTIRYPAGGEAAAQAVQSTIGHGSITEDDAVAAGHILVVAGTDLPKPGSGLRNAGAGAVQPQRWAVPAAADAVPCVN